MTRTISADDLETLARAAHADIELPGPEGGWAVAVINGREYRARVGAVVSKLPGVLAVDDGTCRRCHEPIVPGRDRITWVKGWAIHIKCHKGKETP